MPNSAHSGSQATVAHGELFYLDLLRATLEERKSRNPRYSLRAFAYRLGLDPSTLSRILSGKQLLSVQATHKIVEVLELNSDQKQNFMHSVAEAYMRRTTQSMERGWQTVTFESFEIDPARMPEALELLRGFSRNIDGVRKEQGGCRIEIQVRKLVDLPSPH